MSIKVQILKLGGDISEESGDDTDHQNVHFLRTVSNPDEFIFPHEVIVFSQHMGAKHPLPKQAEPVDYFSQLSATNEDCFVDIIVRDQQIR